MSNKKKMQGGITLISLVITIIVLLILATVAISIAIDSDGLFARARKAAEDWNTSVSDEEKAMENVFEILNEVNIEGTVGGGEMQPPIVEVQSIKLEPTSLSLKEGETAQITATIEPANATNQNIEWSSESDITATVSKNSDGKKATVTAEQAGTTNIVARVDGVEATCNVKVERTLAEGWYQDFTYQGIVEEFTVPITGIYKLEVWGAGGYSERGGNGGYSVGYIKLNADQIIYVCVGGKEGFNGGGVSSSPNKSMRWWCYTHSTI